MTMMFSRDCRTASSRPLVTSEKLFLSLPPQRTTLVATTTRLSSRARRTAPVSPDCRPLLRPLHGRDRECSCRVPPSVLCSALRACVQDEYRGLALGKLARPHTGWPRADGGLHEAGGSTGRRSSGVVRYVACASCARTLMCPSPSDCMTMCKAGILTETANRLREKLEESSSRRAILRGGDVSSHTHLGPSAVAGREWHPLARGAAERAVVTRDDVRWDAMCTNLHNHNDTGRLHLCISTVCSQCSTSWAQRTP